MQETFVSKEGLNSIEKEFSIKKARLWWPYELGKPYLYDVRITVFDGEQKLDVVTGKTGVRQVTMKENPGFTEEECKNPWTFVVNGKEMFLRSACWGGQPSFFYGRNSAKKYRMFLSKAKDANINNLRIFGWHPPETKEFYDICDELGITVWTNFPFATQEFRTDEEYLEKVKNEIAETVKDRRNHPSIVMWMGGEEVYFTEAHVKSGNRKLMELVGQVTRQYTNVPYADASPLSSKEGIRMGYATNESIHANSHYYAAGAIFMEDYYPKLNYAIIPELTAASSPDVESLKKFIPQNELWPMGPSYGYHMADLDVLKILNYEVFGDTCMDSLEHFVEATQIAQGTILQFALEHFRRQKPHVSGVALCHFITNWPIIKWDIVDYYGKEKRSYDFVKRSYEPLLPSLEVKRRRWRQGEEFEGNIWIINDTYDTYKKVMLHYDIIDKDGGIKSTGESVVDIEENSSTMLRNVTWKVLSSVEEKFTVKMKIIQEGEVIASNEMVLLVGDQYEAKRKANSMYQEMHKMREKYGKGYYRYFPSMIDEL